MTRQNRLLIAAGGSLLVVALASAQEVKKRGDTSYMPVDQKEPFRSVLSRMRAEKPKVMKRHMDLLSERFDLSVRPA